MPDQQLASMIASIVEQKLATLKSASNSLSSSTSSVVQPSAQQSAQQHLPGVTSLAPDPSLPPVRNGGQQQIPSSLNFSLSSYQQDLNLGTPEDAALLHTNYRVPSIASHLFNSCIAAITNGLRTLQAPNVVTSASTSTKGFPAPAPPALTLTNKPGCTAAHPGKDHPDSSSSGPTHELNIPVAPCETFAPTTPLEFMGILLDSTRMEARFPLDKLIRAKQALQQ
ncbi:unnamed protein product, partial [Porites evermanni]